MRILINSTWTKPLFIIIFLLLFIPAGFAYPPENAAVLYYKALLLYQPDDDIDDMLSDLAKGKIKSDNKLKEYISSQENVVNTIIEATRVQKCDWGHDYSRGFDMLIPGLAGYRQVSHLVLADARVLAEMEEYKTALERCLALKRVARHIVQSPVLVSHLVGISIETSANDCIGDILSDMPLDVQILTWLKEEIFKIEQNQYSLKTCFDAEEQVVLMEMQFENKERILKLISEWNDSSSPALKAAIEQVRKGDKNFFEKNRDYYRRCMADAKNALNLPYAQAYKKLENIDDQASRVYNEHPDAILTAFFIPAIRKPYSLNIKLRTHCNAVRAAIEIYLVKARTGRLPEKLPAGMPQDLFSGKDFEYEKDDDGFVLRCRGKDLTRDEICEYEFKMSK